MQTQSHMHHFMHKNKLKQNIHVNTCMHKPSWLISRYDKRDGAKQPTWKFTVLMKEVEQLQYKHVTLF